MDNSDKEKIKELLLQKQPISQKELDPMLIFYLDNKIVNNIICKFLLQKTTSDSLRERDFMRFIRRFIVFYVLNYNEYEKQIGKLNEDEIKEHIDLYIRARNKFQKTKTSGEAGELILFLLLESQGISQIVSKMRLKTGTGMAFHGVDAVHLEVKDDKILLHYGEAKMHKTLASGLGDAINSMEGFEGSRKEEDELEIVSTHIDQSKFEKYTDQIVKLISPYENKEDLGHIYSIFLGYDWKTLQDLNARGERELIEYLKEEYEKLHDKYCDKIKDDISDSKINDKRFRFYILPFKDEEKFRESFVEEL